MLNPRRWLDALVNSGSGAEPHHRGWVEPSSETTRAIYASLAEDYEPPFEDMPGAPPAVEVSTRVPAVASNEAGIGEEAAAAKEKHRGIRWRRKKQSHAA
jgi:hypothetical protein